MSIVFPFVQRREDNTSQQQSDSTSFRDQNCPLSPAGRLAKSARGNVLLGSDYCGVHWGASERRGQGGKGEGAGKAPFLAHGHSTHLLAPSQRSLRRWEEAALGRATPGEGSSARS